VRFKPSIHLVDVTECGALIGWGGFWLDRRDGRTWVVDDDDLPPGGTIGSGSPPYGNARVEIRRGPHVVARAESADVNHVWVEGLEPDTAYTYRVTVDGRPWLPVDGRLRTHPAEEALVPVSFAALGDYGVGIVNGEAGRRQAAVARTLTWLAAHRDLRCVIGLGDNIYGGDEDRLEQSGNEDDDWYFTFYEPYRNVIDRVPFYPAAGNHDGPDQEANDDRAQLEDNFHLRARFEPGQALGRASLEPGLFYRLRLGALLELICVDTSWGEEVGQHWFDDERHREWLTGALTAEPAPRWRIPFSHHPPWCAGPSHPGMPELVDRVVPLLQDAGVRLTLHGHEHNLQHGHAAGIDYVISGAGGKLDDRPPSDFAVAGTRSWAAEAHCLLVEVTEDRITVTPYAGMATSDHEPQIVDRRRPDGGTVIDPIVVTR
jgi:tartrate-resistant acid phosphatase type 5